MVLYYKFNDIRGYVLRSESYHINGGFYTPQREERVLDNYEFDFVVKIKPIDIAEYMLGTKAKDVSKDYLKAIEDIIEQFGDDIIESKEFQDFMTEKYEDEAHEKAQEEALEC